MFKISRNLRIIGDTWKYLIVILWSIFLLHPGRFSTMTYDIVSEEELLSAVLIFSGDSKSPAEAESQAENSELLQQLSATNLSLAQPSLRGCNSAAICQPGDSRENLPLVAVVVPYRDRESQLEIFLAYMHHFLQKQKLNYTITVVEQLSESKFNRAKLLNVGYLHIMTQVPDCPCFVFHDVDLIPLDDRNSYVCLRTPRHMSVLIFQKT